jgi:hypothetical protein
MATLSEIVMVMISSRFLSLEGKESSRVVSFVDTFDVLMARSHFKK